MDLPLNGRNAASLITLVAGVADATNEGNGVNQGNGKTFPAAEVTSINGTLPNQSNYLLDGGNNVDEMTNVNGPYPLPDAMQEFSVQTSNYNAEFGQSAGAMVNIVTKSGGSRFHGRHLSSLRNGFFNAEVHFSRRGRHPAPPSIRRHHRRSSHHSPIFEGQRTQFFFGYQHTLYSFGIRARRRLRFPPSLKKAEPPAVSSAMPTLATFAPAASTVQDSAIRQANRFTTHSRASTITINHIPAQRLRSGFSRVREGRSPRTRTQAQEDRRTLSTISPPRFNYLDEYQRSCRP